VFVKLLEQQCVVIVLLGVYCSGLQIHSLFCVQCTSGHLFRFVIQYV